MKTEGNNSIENANSIEAWIYFVIFVFVACCKGPTKKSPTEILCRTFDKLKNDRPFLKTITSLATPAPVKEAISYFFLRRAMSTSSTILQILFLYAAQCLIPATLLIATPKKSILRYLSIPCSTFIVYRAIPVAAALGPGFIWCECSRLFVTIIFQCLNLLLINPKNSNDLCTEGSESFVAQIFAATRFFTDPRGINTPWQIKNVPPQPAYYKRRAMNTPPRGRFLVRQSAIVVWQYLALDVLATLGLQRALEQEKRGMLPPVPQWDMSTEQWIERIISNIMAGFVVSRILIDFHHRAFSIILVGFGLDSPENCPPLYGRALDADTVRGFWG